MALFLITVAVIAALMTLMAVGVIFKGRCLRGSCGDEIFFGPDGEILNCDDCHVRKDYEAGQQH